MSIPQPNESESALSDRVLLTRFVTKRDEAAFRLLVTRYSALVWSVCRRVLPCQQDREDVFQATFLKLILHAQREGWQESIGGWLHTVAYRSSLNVRAAQKRRGKQVEQFAEPWLEDSCFEAIQRQDTERALHQAIQELADRDREAILLCYFQNKSQEEAAQEIGCSLTALRKRLHRSRQKLFVRLGRRGMFFSLALASLQQTLQAAPQAIPPQLVDNVVRLGSANLVENVVSPPQLQLQLKDLCRGDFASMLPSGLATPLLIAIGSFAFSVGSAGNLCSARSDHAVHAALQRTNRVSLLARLPAFSSRPIKDFHQVPEDAAGHSLTSFSAPRSSTPQEEEQQADAKASAPEAIGRLVAQLDSPSAVERDAAAKRLTEIGTPAKAHLETALENSAVEVRYRAQRILDEIYLAELKVLEAFVAGNSNISLPGWSAYHRVVGNGPGSRAFFVEMQKAEQGLLEAYAGGAKNASEIVRWFEQRCNFHESVQDQWRLRFSDQPRPITPLSSLATLLLVAGDDQVRIPENLLFRMCSLLRRSQPMGAEHGWSALDPGFGEMQKLLWRWMQLPNTGQLKAAYWKAGLAKYLSDQRPASLEAIVGDKRLNLEYRCDALRSIGPYNGDARHVSLLEPFLEDDTYYGNDLTGRPILLSDLALATLVYLTGQEPEQFFNIAPVKPSEADNIQLFRIRAIQSPKTVSFYVDAEHRERAFAKWRAWSRANRELRARIEVFAKDLDGSKNILLPGWERYRQIAGDDPDARALFVEMQNAAPVLLEAYEAGSREAVERFAERITCQELPALMAAWLLVAGDDRMPLTPSRLDRGHPFDFWMELHWKNPELAKVIREHRYRAPLRKLLWVVMQRFNDSKEGWERLNSWHANNSPLVCIAMYYRMQPEAHLLAIDALRRYLKGERQDVPVQPLLDAIAKTGGQADRALVEQLLEDQNRCRVAFSFEPEDEWISNLEVRDFALAVLIYLSGEPREKYGIEFVNKENAFDPFSLHRGCYPNVKMADGYNRVEAIAKWREWSQANPITK